MLRRFFPWKYLLQLAAKRFDFVDPLSVVARVRSFAQPSEVQEPIELLRAGIVFHARGLVNTKAIQHNLDWVWPYWVHRQFSPNDPSFIPRAFSFSHINLTHRNWTAVGKPDLPIYPIVDPRGLVTPLHDGWSIDCWFLEDNGTLLCPAALKQVEQRLIDDSNRHIVTRCQDRVGVLHIETAMDENSTVPLLKIVARMETSAEGWLIFSLRPYNPEGVQFIEQAATLENRSGWLVNGEHEVLFDQVPEKIIYSDYRAGDIALQLDQSENDNEQSCRIGMVTAAAFFRVDANDTIRDYSLTMQLPYAESDHNRSALTGWPEAERGSARLLVPDNTTQFLYDTANRTLIHLSAEDVIPGPYTYNRFWFRDACIMLNALLTAGLKERCRKQLDTFADRQRSDGFFHSQDGEWDSNGQVLWILNRYRLLSGGDFNPEWLKPILKGAEWIARKRMHIPGDPKLNGLLPSGFSAEHFGPNDHYYWDDFWAVAGLYSAADFLSAAGKNEEARKIDQLARDMEHDLFTSIAAVALETNNPAIPTSPNRRLDSGAIGCIVADYPLQLTTPGDQRIMATIDYLLSHCLHRGCFFQDMIHSGLNIYMTLELAQVLLRAGDPRFSDLLRAAASFASPTGQWPEAIHPQTGGGCMGDGQHGWAAAEFLMLIRNMFVLEESDSLTIGSGILPEWLACKKYLAYCPTLTRCGRVSVDVAASGDRPTISLSPIWHEHRPERITAVVPGYEPCPLLAPDYTCYLEEKR